MLTYRDRTYCSFYLDCKNACERALTPEVSKDAERLNLPVGQFADKPECYEGA